MGTPFISQTALNSSSHSVGFAHTPIVIHLDACHILLHLPCRAAAGRIYDQLELPKVNIAD